MYVDAKMIEGRLWVNTRGEDHRRDIRPHTPPYVFYYADPSGTYESIFGDKVNRAHFTNRRAFNEAITVKRSRGIKLFETDYSPTFRYLEEKFGDDRLPPLHATFFDIEAETIPGRGWPRPENPYGKITAITIHHVWSDQTFTLVIPPKTHTAESLRKLFSDPEAAKADGFGLMNEERGYYVCESEAELLAIFLELIEDTDILLGWNSGGYDLPYIIARIRMVFGKEFPEQFLSEDGSQQNPFNPNEDSRAMLGKLNLFPCMPSLRMQMMKQKFSNMTVTEKRFFLAGRVHMDYKDMFEKFTLNTIGKLHSYKLDFVLRSQLNDSKLEFDGTLQQLYENNPRRYAAYNRQDTIGVVRLDEKFKLVNLANRLAHMAGVTLDKTLGSVAIIEHAIMKQIAHKQKRVRPDKPEKSRHETIPGAFVVEPEGGIYDWDASADVKSLYPSCARALNLSPETMVGQFLPTLTSPKWNEYFIQYGGAASDSAATRAWSHFTGVLEFEEIHARTQTPLTLSLIDGTEVTQTAEEWYTYLTESGFALSGNGTVFSQDRRGVFAEAIDLWFDERVKAKERASRVEKQRDAEKDEIRKAELEVEFTRWDTLQMAFKIFMNSAYGAASNAHFAFYDPRLGKSITLTGRVITKHMIRQACKEITGKYDFDRNALIYGDTDSVYFRLDWYIREKLGLKLPEVNAENFESEESQSAIKKVVGIADELTKRVNATFPGLLRNSFFCNETNEKYIEAARDVVAVRGLFKDKKKRYALWVVNKEGKPKNEIKIVGMETRRTNTPKYMQKFLEGLIEEILKKNLDYRTTYGIVQKFREETFEKMSPWQYGSSMSVKNIDQVKEALDAYQEKLVAGHVGLKKPTSSNAVPAALATNELIKQYGEERWDLIREGDGVEVLFLLPNPMSYTKVALPVGSTYVPDWFKQLPFDTKRNQAKILDAALFNTVGQVLDWNFDPPQNTAAEVFENKDFFA